MDSTAARHARVTALVGGSNNLRIHRWIFLFFIFWHKSWSAKRFIKNDPTLFLCRGWDPFQPIWPKIQNWLKSQPMAGKDGF
jgi:hypothetical protein